MILHPSQVLEEFSNILCPDLRAVTSDPHRMDDVKQRVKNLVVPFEAAEVDEVARMFDVRLLLHFLAVILRQNDGAVSWIKGSHIV